MEIAMIRPMSKTGQRPTLPQVNASELRARLEQMRALVEKRKDADGEVDVEALGKKVEHTGDPVLRKLFDEIVSEFSDRNTVYLSGWGDQTFVKEPTLLTDAQVAETEKAFTRAAEKVTE